MRCGRAISLSAGLAASKRSSRCSVSVAAALSRAANETCGAALDLAAVLGMEGIVLNSAAMTSTGSTRRTAFRLARWFAAVLAVVILLPYLIAPLYRVVDPVSTLILARRIVGKRVDRTVVPLNRIAP